MATLLAAGGLVAGDAEGWRNAGLRVRTAATIDPLAAARAFGAGELSLLDVRDPGECERLAVPGAAQAPLWQVAAWNPADTRPLAVVCASGGRAAIAASALRGRARQPVLRVDGGVADVLAALAQEPLPLSA